MSTAPWPPDSTWLPAASFTPLLSPVMSPKRNCFPPPPPQPSACNEILCSKVMGLKEGEFAGIPVLMSSGVYVGYIV